LELSIALLLFIFTLGGISLKLADNYGNDAKGYIAATISGVCMGVLISDSPSSSSIVLGIIVGVTLAGKVDQLNLFLGLVLTLITAITLGFSTPDISLLTMIAVATVIDEVGHNKLASKGIFGKFFQFRMFLKITMVLLVVLNLMRLVYALSFLSFDVAYEITDRIKI